MSAPSVRSEDVANIAQELTDSLAYNREYGEGFYVGTYPDRDLIYAYLDDEDRADLERIIESLCQASLALARRDRILKEAVASAYQLNDKDRRGWLDLEPKQE